MLKPRSPGYKIAFIAIFAVLFASIGYLTLHKSQAANADINGDGKVDAIDLSILAAHYNIKSGQTFATGDLNADGAVDIVDLSILASAWNNATVSNCPSSSPVPIQVADNAQNIVNAHTAGTTYMIKTGLHSGFTVKPKNGDTYCAESGAILDGNNTVQYAFFGNSSVNNVSILGKAGSALLEIRNYDPGGTDPTNFKGAIENDSNKNQNWLIRYTNIHHNFPVGLTVGDGTQVKDNKLHDNTTLGISSGGNSNITIDHNEFFNNNSGQINSCNFEAGGVKISVGDHIIYNNNYSHDNGCDGLWNDLGVHLSNPNASFNQITNNILINNGGQSHGSGEHYEISGGPCTISGNYVRGNNYDGSTDNFYEGGQIFVSNSFGCNVFNNTVVGPKGIGLVDDTRSECTTTSSDSDELCPVSGNNIHDNNFYFNGIGLMVGGDCADSTTCGHMVNGVSSFGGVNKWQNNHYHMPNTSASVFSWPNTPINKTQWQSYGFDTTGTFDTNTTPPAQPAWSL